MTGPPQRTDNTLIGADSTDDVSGLKNNLFCKTNMTTFIDNT